MINSCTPAILSGHILSRPLLNTAISRHNDCAFQLLTFDVTLVVVIVKSGSSCERVSVVIVKREGVSGMVKDQERFLVKWLEIWRLNTERLS
jgi:hypothetical protein